MAQDHTFANWREAAANAKGLLERGDIDLDEYNKIQVRAKKEAAAMPKNARHRNAQATPDRGKAGRGSPSRRALGDPTSSRSPGRQTSNRS
jgi:hypothetical protein